MLSKLFSTNFWFPFHMPAWMWVAAIIGGLYIGWKIGENLDKKK